MIFLYNYTHFLKIYKLYGHKVHHIYKEKKYFYFMKKNLIIGGIMVVVLIAGIIIGYFIFKPQNNNRFQKRNLQLTEQQISDINSFFNNDPTSDEITSYCNQNRQNCFYYCKNNNMEDEICKTIMNFSRGPDNLTKMDDYYLNTKRDTLPPQ
jgi:uncharacterized protein YneF (UPF0154 family)